MLTQTYFFPRHMVEDGAPRRGRPSRKKQRLQWLQEATKARQQANKGKTVEGVLMLTSIRMWTFTLNS